MSGSPAPRLSVVIATPDGFATIRSTVAELARQSARDAIELVIVAPSRRELGVDDALLAAFARVAIVEVGAVESIGKANAAGVARASAPVVALAEDHAFPAPGWAAALIAAHEGPWVAVGPAVVNANPASAVSRADLLIGYGPWIAPTDAGERPYLPGHNTSYKREALLAYGDRLPALLDAETLLHWDLRRRGARLYLEPRATIAHVNFSLWRSWLPAQYHYGRLFAGVRAREMSLARRIVYTLGAPLIPPLRLARLWRDRAARGAVAGCLHALAAGLVLDGLGQMVGYALGAGTAGARVSRFEFRRFRHVRADERSTLWPA